MCGIAGIMDIPGRPAGRWRPALECMLDLMAHRGPDDRGSEDLGSVLLGHLRLSIIDLSRRGHQPMSLADGRYRITYNGEVYNYLELRSELEADGAQFVSDTDTEVILQAYHRWGLDCFSRFNGMWALAIWDRQEERLLLSRDRVGIKPLYWCRDGDRLAFASEIKSMLAYRKMTSLDVKLCEASFSSYLATGLADGLDETFIQNVHRLRPGHTMVIENGRIARCQPYWNLPDRALSMRDDRAAGGRGDDPAELAELLADAVDKHMRSDVPVGVCLSGGLDSSTIAALSAKTRPGTKTFTTYFQEGPEYNELAYAEQVNSQFGLESFATAVDGGPLLEKLSDMLWYLDEPARAMGVYPQWHVMESAAREVTVVLDGQGGDEIFAGYDLYAAWFLLSKLAGGDIKAYQRTLAGYRDNYGLGRVDWLGRNVAGLYWQQAAMDLPNVFPGRLDNLLYKELTYNRLPALLRYEDRLSMAFSIESRVPLLDHRLIEYAFSLDEDKKIGPGWSKHALRRSVDSLLPKEITWRKDKMGFPTPFEQWASGPHKLAIRDLLAGPDGKLRRMLPEGQLQQVFDAWDTGQPDAGQLWRLLSAELWLRGYMPRVDLAIETSGRSMGEPADLQTESDIEVVARPPKICHIGGSHSIHVADIVAELDRRGYDQCVIGYFPTQKSIILPHVPVYYFPYRNFLSPQWSQQDMERKLHGLLAGVFEREKPNIVHGHSLDYSCVPTWMAKTQFHLPTVILPWSQETMRKPNPAANARERECTGCVDRFLFPTRQGYKEFQDFYGNLPDEKFWSFRSLVDLATYDQLRPIDDVPRILAARIMGEYYRQDLLIKALPAVCEKFPQATCTLIIGHDEKQGRAYFDKMTDLAEALGVMDRCTFIDRTLPGRQFAELIKQHNITYSLAIHDSGASGTALQSAYSGAVTIVQDLPTLDGFLDHEVNVLRTSIEETAVRDTLLHACENLQGLQRQFQTANRGIRRLDREAMMDSLTDCYTKLLTREESAVATAV